MNHWEELQRILKKSRQYVSGHLEINKFLSLCSYQRGCYKDFCKTARSLRRLAEKNITLDWSLDCQQVFIEVNNCLTNVWQRYLTRDKFKIKNNSLWTTRGAWTKDYDNSRSFARKCDCNLHWSRMDFRIWCMNSYNSYLPRRLQDYYTSYQSDGMVKRKTIPINNYVFVAINVNEIKFQPSRCSMSLYTYVLCWCCTYVDNNRSLYSIFILLTYVVITVESALLFQKMFH